MFRYAIKELIRRNKSYVLNIFVIGLVTCMVLTLTFLGAAYKEAAQLPFKDIHGTIIVQKNGNVPEKIAGVLLSCSLAPIHQNAVDQIKQIKGADDIARALALWVFDADHFKRALGVDWQDSYGKSVAARIIQGSLPRGDNEAVLDKTYASKNNLGAGATLNINNQQFTVTGIMGMAGNEIVEADVYVNLTTAQKMAFESKNLQSTEAIDKTDVNLIFINASQQDQTAVTAAVKDKMANADTNAGQTPLGQTIGSYNIYTPATFEDQISTILRLSDKLIWVISLVLFIGACLIIVRNTLHMILERRKEFGILKTVGYQRKDLQKLVGIETGFQVIAGFAVGILLTAAAVFILSRTTVSIAIPWELTAYPHFLLPNPEDANVVQTHLLPIKFDSVYVAGAFTGALIIGLVTAVSSVWQISRLKPMEILKNE